MMDVFDDIKKKLHDVEKKQTGTRKSKYQKQVTVLQEIENSAAKDTRLKIKSVKKHQLKTIEEKTDKKIEAFLIEAATFAHDTKTKHLQTAPVFFTMDKDNVLHVRPYTDNSVSTDEKTEKIMREKLDEYDEQVILHLQINWPLFVYNKYTADTISIRLLAMDLKKELENNDVEISSVEHMSHQSDFIILDE